MKEINIKATQKKRPQADDMSQGSINTKSTDLHSGVFNNTVSSWGNIINWIKREKWWLIVTVAGSLLASWYVSRSSLKWSIQDSNDIEIFQEFTGHDGIFSFQSESFYIKKYNDAVKYLNSTFGEGEWSSDYLVIVDISEQREYVYTNDGSLYGVYIVSTGSSSVPVTMENTDVEAENNEGAEQEGSSISFEDRSWSKGVWRVRWKYDGDLSAIYGDRLLMLDRYNNGGWYSTNVALHGTNEPEKLGTPFSLGCVYHKNADIIQLYEILSVGDLVVALE